MSVDDLKSRAGQLLYRELPEEYRYQDPAPQGELGDLEAYLHGFGHVLDLIRGTTEQAYADAFAEQADNGRDIQTWLIPYLADLVGAELRAPDPEARRAELNNAVNWFKSKGSLEAVDEISDTLSGAETVVVEGWRHTLTTPRLSLPPFSAPAGAMGSGDPMEAPGLPQGTPDLRFPNRAVRDPDGSNPLFEVDIPSRDDFGREEIAGEVFWTPLARDGAPCFPGAYDDTSMRTPDLRAPETAGIGPHPRRTIIHVRPPEGFFAQGINGNLVPRVTDLPIGEGPERQIIRPVDVLREMGLFPDGAPSPLDLAGEIVLPDRLTLIGSITLPAGVNVEFRNLNFDGTVRINSADTRLTLRECAVRRMNLIVPTDDPALEAYDCLFGAIMGGVGFAQLVHCTVLEQVRLERLWASDCIFNDQLVDLQCSGGQSCIRFSRVPSLDDPQIQGCGADKAPSNTDADPNFIRLWFRDGDDCVLRPAEFGEAGAGVLDLTSHSSITEGAENEGEMGAYNHMFHAAQIRALKLKLTDFLPFGQEIAVRYDPHLSRPPVTLT